MAIPPGAVRGSKQGVLNNPGRSHCVGMPCQERMQLSCPTYDLVDATIVDSLWDRWIIGTRIGNSNNHTPG